MFFVVLETYSGPIWLYMVVFFAFSARVMGYDTICSP